MMTDTAQTVLIYGNSLFVAGVAAELCAMPDLLIERINPAGLRTFAQLCSTCPTVLILDLATTHADLVLTCLMECPTLVLIGLDLQDSRVVVLSSQFFPVTTVQDLTRLIRHLPGGAPP